MRNCTDTSWNRFKWLCVRYWRFLCFWTHYMELSCKSFFFCFYGFCVSYLSTFQMSNNCVIYTVHQNQNPNHLFGICSNKHSFSNTLQRTFNVHSLPFSLLCIFFWLFVCRHVAFLFEMCRFVYQNNTDTEFIYRLIYYSRSVATLKWNTCCLIGCIPNRIVMGYWYIYKFGYFPWMLLWVFKASIFHPSRSINSEYIPGLFSHHPIYSDYFIIFSCF